MPADHGDRPDDDADWLAALSGRPRAGADRAATAEAALLRDALLRWKDTAPALTAADEQAAVDSLLAAARTDPRLVNHRPCRLCAAVRHWLTWPRAAGAAALAFAALATVVVAPWQLLAPQPDAQTPGERMRSGGAEGVQLLQAPDGQQLRDRIADDLALAGVAVQRYEHGGRFGLDAELPLPVSAALAAVLQRHGLQAPPSGGLAVEVETAR